MEPLPEDLFDKVTAALERAGEHDLAGRLARYRSPKKAKPGAARETVLTSKEAANMLGITSINTIKNWMEGGEFPGAYQTPGGHWRFPLKEVEAIKARLEGLAQRNREGNLEPPDLGDDSSGQNR